MSVKLFLVYLWPIHVVAVLCLVAQLCPTFCNPVDCSLPSSSVHGDSPGKNTGVGCHALLQGLFPTQGSNPGLPHCRWILYCLNHQGSPRIREWVAYPFFRIFMIQESNQDLPHRRQIPQGILVNSQIHQGSRLILDPSPVCRTIHVIPLPSFWQVTPLSPWGYKAHQISQINSIVNGDSTGQKDPIFSGDTPTPV